MNERTNEPTDGPSDRTNERTSLHYLPFQNEWLVPHYILLPRILAHIQIIHWPYPDGSGFFLETKERTLSTN